MLLAAGAAVSGILFNDVLSRELSIGLSLIAGLCFLKELTYQRHERIE